MQQCFTCDTISSKNRSMWKNSKQLTSVSTWCLLSSLPIDLRHVPFMECSHWPTPIPTQTQTPIKNGLNYNMQHCSDWPTDANGLQTHFVGVGVGICVGVGQCEHSITHVYRRSGVGSGSTRKTVAQPLCFSVPERGHLAPMKNYRRYAQSCGS